MIKEIVQFTEKLSQEVRQRGIKPKEGLHILLRLEDKDDVFFLDVNEPLNVRYTKKMEDNLTNNEEELLEKLKMLQQNAWMVDTNKCLDAPAKGIHSASPFLIGFKPDFFEGGGKNSSQRGKNKKEIPERFQKYFSKAFDLFEEDERESLSQKYTVFKNFFLQEDSPVYYKTVLDKIVKEYEQETEELENQIKELKEQEKTADKSEKEEFKKKISDKTEKLERYKPLSETDYILFYLDEELETYQKPYNKYLADKLFNTPLFTTKPNENNELFGTSNFRNGFNSSMPFLLHQTATFDISGRISDWEALQLNEFQSILPRKVLPNPLPMFVFENETLNEKVISYFNENDGKVGYKEIITNLINSKNKDKVGNYYLLFYQNTKDGLVFQDFDFVPKFDYYLKNNENKEWRVEEFFESKNSKIIGKIDSVFEFQDKILPVIFNNNLIVRTKEKGIIYKYFDDIEEKYCKSSRNYLSILTYKKAFYDFVYKSQRSAINKTMFDDIMQVSILEDIRLDEIAGYTKEGILHPFHILNKLNIWFSLINYFPSESKTQTSIMASKLPHYRAFVEELADKGAKLDTSTVEVDYFAFTAGQIIAQIFNQSKSESLKYQQLEVYLRVSTLADLIKVISLEFKKYKHGYYTTTFTKVLPFLTSYELEDEKLNDYLPQILAGFFSETLLKPKPKTDSEKSEDED